MVELGELTRRGFASIQEVYDSINGSRFARMDDDELVKITENLFGFPSIIEAVTEHPGHNLKGYDMVLFYHGVKGELSDGLADGQVRRLNRLNRLLKRYISEHDNSANDPHNLAVPETHTLAEVKRHFGDLDIYDGRRLTAVLDGITLAFQCPEIVPSHAREAMRNRWYSTKDFHANYRWGIKSALDLREDGRKGMFLEGVANLNHYLKMH